MGSIMRPATAPYAVDCAQLELLAKTSKIWLGLLVELALVALVPGSLTPAWSAGKPRVSTNRQKTSTATPSTAFSACL
jgi:hypothetical protein